MATPTLQPVRDRAEHALLELFVRTLDADEPAIFAFAIEAAVEATRSEIGYFHLVNEDQETIELGTWSAGTLRQCNAVYDRHYPISRAGVWADSARDRRPRIHNDYPALAERRGLPEGHVPLRRHLGVPVLHGGRVVLLVGVGNKATDYDGDDLRCLQSIADSAWALICRRRERMALELAERQLRDLQSVAAISVWEWDPDDRRLSFDENVGRVFAIANANDLPQSVEGLLRYVEPKDHGVVLDVLRSPSEGETFDLDVRGLRADGVPVTVHVRGAAYRRSQGHGVVLRGLLQDVTERREMGRLRYQAGHDTLTGLANRASLVAEIESALRNHRRSPDDVFAIHYVDLDRFKAVNDTLGHSAGDVVLKVVANRLLHATRWDDLVGRLGGDELVVVQKHVTHTGAAEALATKIVRAIGEPIEAAGQPVEVGASVGIALAVSGSETAEELIARADRAMYRAKETGAGYQVG